MNAVLEWVKANLFIVVFVVLMLAAVVVLPIVSGGMNAKVRRNVEYRAKKNNDLKSLETVELLPGKTGVVNEPFLARYEQVNKAAAEDADAVLKAAIDHNRKGRTVLMPEVLPEMSSDMRDVLPRRFHEALMAAYGDLLTQVQAGMPPAIDSMRDEITRVRVQFINQDLKKDIADALEPDQQKLLTERLSNTRMSMYTEAAQKIGLYLSLDQLSTPRFDRTNQPSPCEMYNWQWQFWITEDILHALHEVNKDDHWVTQAPVKQVLDLRVLGLPSGSESSSGAGNTGAPMGGGFGAGGGLSMGAGGAAPPADAGAGAGAAAGDTAPNPGAAVPQNFGASITGRVTNPLYDVIDVDLDLVVETARLPEVLDELSKWNFITVTDLRVQPADPFVAAQGGFVYGGAAMSRVNLRLETVWLREWTWQFMPRCTKQALGMPLDQPPPAAPPPAT